jgi:hypothetical protein
MQELSPGNNNRGELCMLADGLFCHLRVKKLQRIRSQDNIPRSTKRTRADAYIIVKAKTNAILRISLRVISPGTLAVLTVFFIVSRRRRIYLGCNLLGYL